MLFRSHGCRPPAARAGRLATTCLLLQEAQPGTTEIQCLRPGAPGNLRGSEVLPAHAGGPSFHHPDGPQASHLRLPPEDGQIHHASLTIWTSSPTSRPTSDTYPAKTTSSPMHFSGLRQSPRQQHTTHLPQPRRTTNNGRSW